MGDLLLCGENNFLDDHASMTRTITLEGQRFFRRISALRIPLSWIFAISSEVHWT